MQTSSEMNLTGPAGQVYALAVANELLFAAIEIIVSDMSAVPSTSPFEIRQLARCRCALFWSSRLPLSFSSIFIPCLDVPKHHHLFVNANVAILHHYAQRHAVMACQINAAQVKFLTYLLLFCQEIQQGKPLLR